ncbi:acyltransferase family protein [Acidisoma sp.]|uniref:acyltransferase family protein n=1 Tax=Acidisoma sp. TaxID=1872115 RepID=UPI003B00EBE4
MPDATTARATGEIRALTGIRGVAAVLVVLYHFDLFHVAFSKPPTRLLAHGYLAVDLFFVLSGFVMALTYARLFRPVMTRAAYGKFLGARFARVYPLYLIATVVAFLQVHYVFHGFIEPGRALLSDALMVQNLGAGWACAGCGDNLLAPAWSISTEAAAYLLFPVLVSIALFRSRTASYAAAAASVVALIALCIVPNSTRGAGLLNIFSGNAPAWPLIRCLAGFMLGLVAYRVSLRIAAAQRGLGMDLALLGALTALWLVPDADVAIVVLFPLLILRFVPTPPHSRAPLGPGCPMRSANGPMPST